MQKKFTDQERLDVRFVSTPPGRVSWGPVNYRGVPMVVGISGDGDLCRLSFLRDATLADVVTGWKKQWPKTEFTRDTGAAKEAEVAMKNGKTIRVRMSGSPFQREVWKNLLTIPEGEVVSYAELARRAKRTKAVRAAGTACGANPVAVLVPCHRVLTSNGGLGGFGGGLELKKKLLKAEGFQQFKLAKKSK